MTVLFSDVSFGPVEILIWGPPLLVFLAVAALCALAVFLITRAVRKNKRGKTDGADAGKTENDDTAPRTEPENDAADIEKRE